MSGLFCEECLAMGGFAEDGEGGGAGVSTDGGADAAKFDADFGR